jgi:hypothetical protein
MEYLDLTRAESVIKRAEDGVCVAPRILMQAHTMRALCKVRVFQLSGGIDLDAKCPDSPASLVGGSQ